MDRLFLPRRRVLAASIAGATALSLPAVLRAAAAGLSPTPEQTEGPFYPLNYPADSDNDLAHVAGHAEPAKGTMTRVAGQPQNERDPVLLGVRDPAARARLIVPLRAAPEIGREALAAEFDIVLA